MAQHPWFIAGFCGHRRSLVPERDSEADKYGATAGNVTRNQ